jgi:phage FluMu gp28-like protein
MLSVIEAQKHMNEKAVKEHMKTLSMAVKLSVIRYGNTSSVLANVRFFKQIKSTVYIEKLRQNQRMWKDGNLLKGFKIN